MYTHVSKCKNEKIIKKIEWKASSVDWVKWKTVSGIEDKVDVIEKVS
jgi:hypothetical protein